ncbi:MAG: hypothetical protein Crog4KO_35090 [Crocinitomicaceae bacterium]
MTDKNEDKKMKQVNVKQKAQEIVDALQEEAYGPRVSIERLIRHIGLDFVEATLAETQEIQANGGMLIKDGSRQRSMGGVFMYLAKSKLDPEIRNRIFPNSHQRKKKKKATQTEQSSQEPIGTRVEDTTNEADSTESEEIQQLKAVVSPELKKLKTAATTLRQRLQTMEDNGQKGVKMTRKLLTNTERKIALLQQASSSV